MKVKNMDKEEFRKKYEKKVEKFGYKFDGAGEHEDYIQINYINKKKNTLLVFGVDKESNDAFAQLLVFEDEKMKTEYNFPTLDELFKFLEKEE